MLNAFKSFLSMFKSSTGNLDMSRVLAFKSMSCFSIAFLWAVFRLHQVINWAELGMGYAAVMAGCVAFIGGKEIAIAKTNQLNSGTEYDTKQ